MTIKGLINNKGVNAMYDIKKLEIPKELYSEAFEIECIILSEDEGEMIKGYELAKDFEVKHKFDTFEIIQEYQRREKNTEKPLNKLQDKDKNTYSIICTNRNIIEMKYKCFYFKHIKNTNEAIIIGQNIDKNKPIIFKRIRGVKDVICIERNNNLDYKNDRDWWKKKVEESGNLEMNGITIKAKNNC